MDTLVQQLSEGSHPIALGGPNPTLADLKRRILELDYVFLKFTATQGGTDLGMRIDKDKLNVKAADLERANGLFHIEGELTLNDVKVRCVADLDLHTLQGQGHLVPLETSQHALSSPCDTE